MIDYKLKIDLQGQREQHTNLVLTAGDSRGYCLHIGFYSYGERLDVSKYALTVKAKRADGQVICDAGETKTDEAVYLIADNMYAVPGTVEMEIALVGEEQSVVTSAVFVCRVREGFGEANLQADNTAPVLAKTVAVAKQAELVAAEAKEAVAALAAETDEKLQEKVEKNQLFDEKPSNNLLDMSAVTEGIYGSKGTLYTGESYANYSSVDGYIPVSEGDVISTQFLYKTGKRLWSKDATYGPKINRLIAYDDRFNLLSEHYNSSAVTEYTIPTGVAYIKVSFNMNILTTTEFSEFAIVKNVSDVVPYEEYGTVPMIKEELFPVGRVLAFLPDEICCATGRTVEIYNNQVCPVAEKYHFKWDCAVGKALKRKFSITGTEALLGEYPLTLTIYDDDLNVLFTKTTTLKVVTELKATSHIIRVCPIGDSLTNDKYWLEEVVILSDAHITFVGTRGTSTVTKHEGRSGFTGSSYLAATEYAFEGEGVHPFWDGTKFSWAHYKETTGLSPDAVQIFLGTNDLSGDTTAEVFASNVKQMVDAIREDDASIPVYVVLTLCYGNQNGIGVQTSSDGFASNSGKFKYDMDCRIVSGVKTLYNTLKDYAGVYFVPLTQCHDSEYNFGAVETPVNPRASQTELMPVEAVHPKQQGYEQMADVIYSAISAHTS